MFFLISSLLIISCSILAVRMVKTFCVTLYVSELQTCTPMTEFFVTDQSADVLGDLLANRGSVFKRLTLR